MKYRTEKKNPHFYSHNYFCEFVKSLRIGMTNNKYGKFFPTAVELFSLSSTLICVTSAVLDRTRRISVSLGSTSGFQFRSQHSTESSKLQLGFQKKKCFSNSLHYCIFYEQLMLYHVFRGKLSDSSNSISSITIKYGTL